VRAARTTISCRSIPLILAIALLTAAASASSFFPIATVWRRPVPSGPSAPPLADAERVFVPLLAGRLAALSVASGLEQWSIALSVKHRPALGAGMLIVATDDDVRALDAATGTLRWQTPTGPLAAAPIWRDGWIVAGTTDGELFAMRADDGSVVWRRRTGRLSAPPSIDGDRVLLPLDAGRVALAALTTGEERWSRQLGGTPGPVLPDGDRLFVGARDNHFYCLDATDGEIRWRWRTAADVIAPAVVDQERVYFVSLDNVVRALDRSHGAQRWRRALPMRALDGPLIAGGLIAIGGLSAEVLFFDARDGAPAGRWSAGEQLGAPVVLTPGADRIRMIAIAGGIASEWIVMGVGASDETPLVPLSDAPGTPLPPEAAPTPRGS
jgi:outer membrane protein assembly factor BamB